MDEEELLKITPYYVSVADVNKIELKEVGENRGGLFINHNNSRKVYGQMEMYDRLVEIFTKQFVGAVGYCGIRQLEGGKNS